MNSMKKINIPVILFLFVFQFLSVLNAAGNALDLTNSEKKLNSSIVDIDGNGLLDLVVGTLDGKLFHYEQPTINSAEMILVTENFGNFDQDFYSTPAFIDVDNDGFLDMFIGDYSGKISHYKQDKKNSYSFSLVTDHFAYIDAGKDPTIAFADIDGNGLFDLFIGTLNDNIVHYEQDEVNSTSFSLSSYDFSSIEAGHYLTPTFVDLDNNGLLEIVIGRLYNNLILFEQDEINSTSFHERTEDKMNIGSEYYSPPRILDIDKNGLLDMFIGKNNGEIDHYEQKRPNEINFELKKQVEYTAVDNKIDLPEVKAPVKVTPEVISEFSDESSETDIAKKALADKTAEFDNIREKMAVSKSQEEYNNLYDEYKSVWAELSEIKKKIKEIELEKTNQCVSLYNEALEAKNMEDYEDALDLLHEAIELKEDFDEAYYQIVSILIKIEADDEIDEYIENISDKETKGKAYYHRAMSVKDRYPKKAVAYLNVMSGLYKPELAFYNIGLINVVMLSDLKTAVGFLERSLKIDPDDPKVLDLTGAVYLDMKTSGGEDKSKNIEKAVEYLERGVRVGNNYNKLDILLTRLSQAYNRLGNAQNALKYAELALEIISEEHFSLANLEKGKALVSLSRLNEAKKFLLLAKDNPVTQEEANYWLNQL